MKEKSIFICNIWDTYENIRCVVVLSTVLKKKYWVGLICENVIFNQPCIDFQSNYFHKYVKYICKHREYAYTLMEHIKPYL